MNGRPNAPAPSERYSPFMCTPSNASGALVRQMASTRSSDSPHEASASREASHASSLPVSCARRTNRVIPAPTTATRLGTSGTCPGALGDRRRVLDQLHRVPVRVVERGVTRDPRHLAQVLREHDAAFLKRSLGQIEVG